MKRIILSLLLLFSVGTTFAQYPDAAETGVITYGTVQQKKPLKRVNEINLLESGMLATHQELWHETYNIQKQFHNYLDSLKDIVIYAAQAYGIYKEINYTIQTMEDLEAAFADNPTGSLALALSPTKQSIYTDCTLEVGNLLKDLNTIFMGSKKLTEKDRIHMIFSIRPRIRAMNVRIGHLVKAIRYSSLSDLYIELHMMQPVRKSKQEIATACQLRWAARCNIKPHSR